ncbi:MAG: YvcK family protein [Candidatus Omnitrophica bacterium]|nr:YvcK family protein [Candidatus Omnitrophota bacterium]
MSRLKWLYPGMLVKRWVFLIAVGIILIAMGFAVVLMENNPETRTYTAFTIIAGIVLVIWGIRGTIRSLLDAYLPKRQKEIVDTVYEKRILEKGPKIVVIGGGTGLSALLHGLKEYTSNITAVVTVADDGGSSGRLREELDVLPPGDIRNCLVALADTEPLMEKLFQFRFADGKDLNGHSFGNLFITALSKVTGDFEEAVKASSKILAIRGNVIPATLSKIVLKARYKDGTETEGESKIPESKSPIERVYIKPADSRPTLGALQAIQKAQAIILGPGSLYTSIMPNLLIEGMHEAIRKSNAVKIYICNVMTQAGETSNYTASRHVKTIIDHTGSGIINFCIVNTGKVPSELVEKYKDENAHPVVVDKNKFRALKCTVIQDNVIDTKDFVRHDSHKLAKTIFDLVSSIKK